jgi:hypothetical protein
MVKLIQLSSRDGLEEPLQAITKARVWLELSGLPSTVTGMSRSTIRTPAQKACSASDRPAQGQMAKAADRSRFE